MQLRLWDPPRIDLTAKIAQERKMGIKIFYHFCDTVLPMVKPISQSRPA